MKSFNKTKIFLGIALVCTMAAAGIYAFFYVSMSTKTDAAIALAARLHEFSGQRRRYATASSDLQAEKLNIEKLSSYFIKEGAIVSFTKKIEALGPKAGVSLSIESLDPSTASGDNATLGFRINADGKFENIQRLLTILQNFPGKFQWNTVRLVRISGGSEPVTTSPKVGKAPAGAEVPVWKVSVSIVALNFIKE